MNYLEKLAKADLSKITNKSLRSEVEKALKDKTDYNKLYKDKANLKGSKKALFDSQTENHKMLHNMISKKFPGALETLGTAKVKEGKMHKLLKLPKDMKVSVAYTSGKKLAEDLLKATGDKDEAMKMLVFAANIDKEDNVFDRAVRALKKMDPPKPGSKKPAAKKSDPKKPAKVKTSPRVKKMIDLDEREVKHSDNVRRYESGPEYSEAKRAQSQKWLSDVYEQREKLSKEFTAAEQEEYERLMALPWEEMFDAPVLYGNKGKSLEEYQKEFHRIMKMDYGLNPNDIDWDATYIEQDFNDKVEPRDLAEQYGSKYDLDMIAGPSSYPLFFKEEKPAESERSLEEYEKEFKRIAKIKFGLDPSEIEWDKNYIKSDYEFKVEPEELATQYGLKYDLMDQTDPGSLGSMSGSSQPPFFKKEKPAAKNLAEIYRHYESGILYKLLPDGKYRMLGKKTTKSFKKSDVERYPINLGPKNTVSIVDGRDRVFETALNQNDADFIMTRKGYDSFAYQTEDKNILQDLEAESKPKAKSKADIVADFVKKHGKEKIHMELHTNYPDEVYKKDLKELYDQGIDFEQEDYDDYYYVNFWDTDFDPPKGQIKQLKITRSQVAQSWDEKVKVKNADYFKMIDMGMVNPGGSVEFSEKDETVTVIDAKGKVTSVYNIKPDFQMEIDHEKTKQKEAAKKAPAKKSPYSSDVRAAIEYYEDAGFIEELTTDKRHYTEALIKFAKDGGKPWEKDTADAIEYFEDAGFIEELTTDKKYYTQMLIDHAKKHRPGKQKAPISLAERASLVRWFVNLPIEDQLNITGIKRKTNTESLWHDLEAKFSSYPDDKKRKIYVDYTKKTKGIDSKGRMMPAELNKQGFSTKHPFVGQKVKTDFRTETGEVLGYRKKAPGYEVAIFYPDLGFSEAVTTPGVEIKFVDFKDPDVADIIYEPIKGPDGPIEGSIRWNPMYSRYQTSIGGEPGEEFVTVEEAQDFMEGAGFKKHYTPIKISKAIQFYNDTDLAVGLTVGKAVGKGPQSIVFLKKDFKTTAGLPVTNLNALQGVLTGPYAILSSGKKGFEISPNRSPGYNDADLSRWSKYFQIAKKFKQKHLPIVTDVSKYPSGFSALVNELVYSDHKHSLGFSPGSHQYIDIEHQFQYRDEDSIHYVAEYMADSLTVDDDVRKEIRGFADWLGNKLSGIDTTPSETSDLLAYRLEVNNDPKGTIGDLLVKNIAKSGDLCQISPPVCVDNLGIPRAEMPQLSDEVVEKFIQAYRDKGIAVTNSTIHVGKLKATQKEINGKKVIGLKKAVENEGLDIKSNPIIVSKDNYILDGHHRWATLLVMDPSNEISVHKVDLPIKQILEDAANFEGVEQRAFDDSASKDKPALKSVPKRLAAFIPEHQLKATRSTMKSNPEALGGQLSDLLSIIDNMPKTYETDGINYKQKTAWLHYFSSGSDWYIVERDMSEEQLQAYGYIVLNGDMRNAELGYVNIEEIGKIPQVELDYYWTPKKLGQIIGEKTPAAPAKSKSTTEDKSKFIVGREYLMGWIGDSQLKTVLKVTKRTEKFVTFQIRNEDPKRVKIHISTDGKSEYAYPTGSYSMAPSVSSKDLITTDPETKAETFVDGEGYTRTTAKGPDKIHDEKDGFYISESYIPYDQKYNRIVYFVSSDKGDEYGQFTTLEKARKRLAEVKERMKPEKDAGVVKALASADEARKIANEIIADWEKRKKRKITSIYDNRSEFETTLAMAVSSLATDAKMDKAEIKKTILGRKVNIKDSETPYTESMIGFYEESILNTVQEVIIDVKKNQFQAGYKYLDISDNFLKDNGFKKLKNVRIKRENPISKKEETIEFEAYRKGNVLISTRARSPFSYVGLMATNAKEGKEVFHLINSDKTPYAKDLSYYWNGFGGLPYSDAIKILKDGDDNGGSPAKPKPDPKTPKAPAAPKASAAPTAPKPFTNSPYSKTHQIISPEMARDHLGEWDIGEFKSGKISKVKTKKEIDAVEKASGFLVAPKKDIAKGAKHTTAKDAELAKIIDKEIDNVVGGKMYFKTPSNRWVEAVVHNILAANKDKSEWVIEFYPVGGEAELPKPMTSDRLSSNQIHNFIHGEQVKNYTIKKPRAKVIANYNQAQKDIDECKEMLRTERIQQRRDNPPVQKQTYTKYKESNETYVEKMFRVAKENGADDKKLKKMAQMMIRHHKELLELIYGNDKDPKQQEEAIKKLFNMKFRTNGKLE